MTFSIICVSAVVTSLVTAALCVSPTPISSNTTNVTCNIGSQPINGTCQLCPPGTYKRARGPEACKGCPPDTFTPFRGVTQYRLCLRCPRESTSYGRSTHCRACPAGLIGACGKCIGCRPGTFYNQYLCKCERCEEREFSDEYNSASCTTCALGLTPAQPGRDKCVPAVCDEGYGHDGYECLPCDYNTFRTGDMQQCEQCPFGLVTNNFNGPNTRCIKCPAGEYVSDLLSQTFTFESSPLCMTCPGNSTTRGEGKPACRIPGNPCPPNTFVDAEGDCNICATDHMLDSTRTSCVPCPKGSVSKAGLATVCTRCKRHAVPDGRGGCSCGLGYNMIDGRCKACRRGTYAPYSNGCLDCDSGTISKLAATTCTPCPAGSSTVGDDRRKCRKFPKCPIGYSSGHDESSRFGPHLCLSGRTGCPLGARQMLRGNSQLCVKPDRSVVCPTNFAFNRRASCVHCPISAYLADVDGVLRCKQCPKGTVSVVPNSLECKRCTNGFRPLDPYDRSDCICPREKYINSKGRCVLCPKNTFNSDFNATSCTVCPDTFVTNGGEFGRQFCACPTPRVIDINGKCVEDNSGVSDYPR